MKKYLSIAIPLVILIIVAVGLITHTKPQHSIVSQQTLGAKPFNNNWWAEVSNDPNTILSAEMYLNEKILDGTVSGEVIASSIQEIRYRGFELLNQKLSEQEKAEPIKKAGSDAYQVIEMMKTGIPIEDAKLQIASEAVEELLGGAGEETVGSILTKIDNLNY